MSDLFTYTLAGVQGEKGGRFVVRVKKEDLDKYYATRLSETKDMDIEIGNYIIPPSVGTSSQVEVAVFFKVFFKDSWEGKKNVPMADWKEVENYINENLTDEAIIPKLENNS